MRTKTKPRRATIAALLVSLAVGNLLGQQPQKPSQSGYVVRVSTEVVLVNAIARDKKGNLIRDLKKEDFTVYEDGQRQQLTSFDFENVDELTAAGAADTTVTGAAGNAGAAGASSAGASGGPPRVGGGSEHLISWISFASMRSEHLPPYGGSISVRQRIPGSVNRK